MICSSVVPDCPTLALVLGLGITPQCWLRIRPDWPSETNKAQSLLTINMVLIDTKWPWSRTGLILKAAGSVKRKGLWELRWEVQGETLRKSWFCVFSAKGPLSFRWWHSILLTQQCLWAAMPGFLGDLLSMIHPKLPQIIGMPWSWNHI